MFDFDPKKDYYSVLWVAETATDDEIKKAFRKAAMKHHPDKWWNAEKFKEINEANMILSDKSKRNQYDSVRKGWFGWFGWGGWFGWSWWWFGWFWWFGNGWFQVEFGPWWGFGDLGDIIEQFMWWMGGWGFSKRPRKWEDLRIQISISFADSYHGVERTIDYVKQIQDGQYLKSEKKSITVTIPKNIEDGQFIKYTGMGNGGINWWPDGDLYVKIQVTKDKLWHRSGDNIVVKINVDIFQLILGWTVLVDHPDGKVEVKIPKWTQPHDIVRVKGKGFGKWWFFESKWDLLVHLVVQTPSSMTSTQEKQRKELQKSYK